MLYKKKTKPEHMVVNTGCKSATSQDRFIKYNHPGWKRCSNIRHHIKFFDTRRVCLKEKKV